VSDFGKKFLAMCEENFFSINLSPRAKIILLQYDLRSKKYFRAQLFAMGEREQFYITSISHGGILSSNSLNEVVLTDWLEKINSHNTWAIERTLLKTRPQEIQDNSFNTGFAAVTNFLMPQQTQKQKPQPKSKSSQPGNLILYRGTYVLVFDDFGNTPALIHSHDDSCAQWRFVLSQDKKTNYIFHSESHKYLKSSKSLIERDGQNEYLVTLEELHDSNDPSFLWKVTSTEQLKEIDNSQWMYNMRKFLNPKKLSEIVLPGSNNSGSFGIRDDSQFSSDQPWMQDYIGKMGSLAISAVLPWARTQEHSLLRQLKDGIRYFDFRVSLGLDQEGRSELYLVHFLHGQKVSEAILEILSFLESKNEELIIVDINCFFGLTQSDHQDLANQIITFLGDYIVPSNVRPSATYHHIINIIKKRLIVIYHDDFITQNYSEFWSKYSISSPFDQTTLPEELKV
jgi:hypothetical protein